MVSLNPGDIIQHIQTKAIFEVRSVFGAAAHVRQIKGPKPKPDEQVIKVIGLARFERTWRTSRILQVLYGRKPETI